MIIQSIKYLWSENTAFKYSVLLFLVCFVMMYFVFFSSLSQPKPSITHHKSSSASQQIGNNGFTLFGIRFF